MQSNPIKKSIFQHTKISISHYTKANAQLQISSAKAYCELAVHLFFFEKTSVLRLHYGNPFAPIQSLFAGVLQAKPVSTGAAGNFCKLTSGRALNRPRSPEVRKPLACFLVLFAQRKKHEKRSFRKKLRGSANLESAHRNGSFAPQQLKPFIKEDPRFRKLRISAHKQQIRTNKLKSSAASRHLSAAKPLLKLSFRKVLPLSGQHARRALCRPWRHFPMLLPQQIFALRAVFGGKPPKKLSVCTEGQCVRMTFPIFLLAYSTLCACSGCSNGNVA